MKQRVISIVMCVVMLAILPAGAVPASAAGSTSFKLETDRITVSPGDTVTYTVSIGPVEDLFGLKLKMVIPEGLTYVEGSGTITEGLEATMESAKVEFIESTMVFIVGACAYTSTADTVLLQFQCTVDADAVGSKVVHFDIDPENVFDQAYENIEYTTASAAILVDRPCVHEWIDDDCTSPKTCSLCGMVDEAVFEHSWPDTCFGSGDENGHWYDCSVCSMSRIEAHSDADDDGVCDICGYRISERSGSAAVVIVIAVLLIGACVLIVLIRKKRK